MRKLPPIDPLRAKIVDDEVERTEEVKKPPSSLIDVSIDDLLSIGLTTLSRLMQSLAVQVTDGTYDRETIMNLKDAMAMLKDLKKEEKDLLDNMSDDQLAQLVKISKNDSFK